MSTREDCRIPARLEGGSGGLWISDGVGRFVRGYLSRFERV